MLLHSCSPLRSEYFATYQCDHQDYFSFYSGISHCLSPIAKTKSFSADAILSVSVQAVQETNNQNRGDIFKDSHQVVSLCVVIMSRFVSHYLRLLVWKLPRAS